MYSGVEECLFSIAFCKMNSMLNLETTDICPLIRFITHYFITHTYKNKEYMAFMAPTVWDTKVTFNRVWYIPSSSKKKVLKVISKVIK